MLLGDIADIKVGLVTTRKKVNLPEEVQATYKMFTIKNIDSHNTEFEAFKSNEVLAPQYFTTVGDVLFRLNYPYSAVLIDETKVGLLIPSTFAVLRVQIESFLPAYIAWYMNTAFVKKELEKGQAGTRIPSTNKATLGAVWIEPLELEKQQNIVQLYNLHLKEKQLLMKLIEEKEKLFHVLTTKMLQEKN